MSKCIEHNQKGTGMGYGTISHKGRPAVMHRIAYCFARGIPVEYIKGYVIRHTCDNPRCINPQHLLIGDNQDNSDDAVGRNRQATGTRVGTSVLTDEQVRFIHENYVPRSRTHGSNQIAKLLGVSGRMVRYIAAGDFWRGSSSGVL